MDLTSNPLVKSFLAGSFSGTCSIILFQPFDLVKTRIQVATSPALAGITTNSALQTTMWNVGRTVVQNDSLRGLWKGFVPSFLRCVPGVGMYFSSLHWLKQKYLSDRKPTSKESLILGASARTLTTVCMLPMTVIKTRFESGQFGYKSVHEAMYTIYSKEGTAGLYRGIFATLLRDAPFSGIYLMFYNSMKSTFPYEGNTATFGCGIVAGVAASCITQPADVIKTHKQLHSSTERVRDIAYLIYQKNGIRGYFSGLVPRVTRRTLMAAMAWTVYEQVGKLLKL
uniref:Mitochondrial glycine transporter n=1 Tax=Phallusia mammillata TaxID=59560 RepID=A0A6F9DT42_9ASCI|nr:solute carrier family 25 member 40-like [Phallusia mammillata]